MVSQNEPITINTFPSKESLKLFDKNIFLRHDRHEHEYVDVKKEHKISNVINYFSSVCFISIFKNIHFFSIAVLVKKFSRLNYG